MCVIFVEYPPMYERHRAEVGWVLTPYGEAYRPDNDGQVFDNLRHIFGASFKLPVRGLRGLCVAHGPDGGVLYS